MTFDPKWPHGHVTSDGRKARIICTDAVGDYPIVALVRTPNGSEYPSMYCADGEGLLLNAQAPARWMYVNVYPDGGVYPAYDTRAEADHADHAASRRRTGCIRIKIVAIDAALAALPLNTMEPTP